MAIEYARGTLIGIRDGFDGPIIVLGVMGQEQKLPLACEVGIDFAYSRMNTPVVCEVENGKVIKVQ